MQKPYFLLVCALLLAGLLALPAGAATFDIIHEIKAESNSEYETYSYGGSGSISATSTYPICLRFASIEQLNNYQDITLYWKTAITPTSFYKITDTGISSGSTTAEFYYDSITPSNLIGNGTINYNLIYTDQNPTFIQVWVEIDELTLPSGVTGTKTVAIDYNLENINGLAFNRYYSSVTANPSYFYTPYVCTSSGKAVYISEYIFYGYVGKSIEWIITPNDGENPSNFNVNISRGGSFSEIMAYTADHIYMDDSSSYDLDFDIYTYPIYIDVKFSSTWYNFTYYSFERDYWTLTLDNDEPDLYQSITATLNEESGAPAIMYVSYWQYADWLSDQNYQRPAYFNEDDAGVQFQKTGSQWYKFNTSSLNFDIPVTEAEVYTWTTKFYSPGSYEVRALVVPTDADIDPVLLAVPVEVAESGNEAEITFRPLEAGSGASIWCDYTLLDHTSNLTYTGGGTVHTLLIPIGHVLSYTASKTGYFDGTWNGTVMADGESHIVYLHKIPSAGEGYGEVELVARNDQGMVIGAVTYRVSNGTWSQSKVGEYVTFTVMQGQTYSYTATKSHFQTATGSFNLSSSYELIEIQMSSSMDVTVTATTPTWTGTPRDAGEAMDRAASPFIENADAIGALLFLALIVGIFGMITGKKR